MENSKSKKNTKECGRIIFQPTKENNDKLKLICEKTGFSYSIILNLLLNIIDIDTKVILDINEKQRNKIEKLSKFISKISDINEIE